MTTNHTTEPGDGVGAIDILRLVAERNFLLARAGHAGSAYFGPGRWTGMSSNALVTVAFGGSDDSLPSDVGDLAACYRTVLRLPEHLRTVAVMAQLKRGEEHVERKYPGSIVWARDAAEYPTTQEARHD